MSRVKVSLEYLLFVESFVRKVNSSDFTELGDNMYTNSVLQTGCLTGMIVTVRNVGCSIFAT